MKRSIIILAAMLAATTALAQPRSAGVRMGAGGLEASYQHSTFRDQFIDVNAGLDFGYNANGRLGYKVTAIYNFIWARPAWTSRGSWELYAGPGLSMGGVDHQAVHKVGKERFGYNDGGFMLAVAAQVGVGYEFEFPLQVSLDVRPCFGFHINDGTHSDPVTGVTINYGSNAGFYDNGMMGFIPSVSVRYRF